MLELLGLALAIGLGGLASGIGLMCLFTSNWYLNKMTKKSIKMAEEMTRAMEEGGLL